MNFPVLTYHAANVTGSDYANNDQVALQSDLRQLAHLGWRVVPLDWVVEQRLGMADRDLRRCVALTCDDGTDLDVRAIEVPGVGRQPGFLPVLRALGAAPDNPHPELEMTSFVIADPAARELMDRECLHGLGWMNEHWWRDAARSGLMSVQCHSWDHNHPKLRDEGPEGMVRGDFFAVDREARAEFQVEQAVDYINARLGPGAVRYFGYPFGQAPEYLVRDYFPRHGQRLGLRAAFGTQGEPVTAASDRWNLPRYICGWHWKSPEDLARLLSGLD
ncbi:polysaccharide deacetylase family protein [Arenimonas alkanexedens]